MCIDELNYSIFLFFKYKLNELVYFYLIYFSHMSVKKSTTQKDTKKIAESEPSFFILTEDMRKQPS